MNAKALIASLSAFAFLGCATLKEEQAAETAAPSTAPAPQASASVIPPRPLEATPPMRSILKPEEKKPIVSLRLVFRSGSIDDPLGKEGLTALTAELMKSGGTRELTSSQVLQALYPIAGEVRVQTDKELTVFAGRVHRDNVDKFLKIFTDMLLQPRFDAKELERVRASFLDGVKNGLRNEDDEELGKEALSAMIFEHHPYGHYDGGTVQGLKSITLDDVKTQAQKLFTQDRLIIGLAGAVDAKLEKQVKDRLALLPATGAPAVQLPPVPVQGGRAVILGKDTLSTAISFGMPVSVRRGDPDFFPLVVAMSYLGEHRQFHGMMFRELREARGLNYGDYAYPEYFSQEGGSTYSSTNLAREQQEITWWLRPVEPQNTLFAVRGALYYLNDLLQNGIPKDRFELTRGFLLGYSRLWDQTDQRRLGYATDSLLYGTPDYLDQLRKALSTMTPEQVQAAARKHLDPKKLSFAFVAKDAAGLRTALAEQKPSPIQYPSPKAPEVLEVDKRIEVTPIPVDAGKITLEDAQTFMAK